MYMYMSQIIKNENQSLLWNTIQQTVQFKNSIISESNKIQLFKDVMKIFYEKIKTRNQKLSKQDLENYNKQIIQTYLQELQKYQKYDNIIFETQNVERYKPQEPREPQEQQEPREPRDPTKHVTFQIPENNNLIQHMSFRPIQPINNKENPMEVFTQRQLEYETMTKRELPLEPNFKEKIEDTVIVNMEELLQQQIRKRELDLQQINPINSKSFISSIDNNDFLKGVPVKPIPYKLKINEETDNIIIDVQSLNDDNRSPPSWFKDLLETIKDMKDTMKDMKDTMKDMNDTMKDMKVLGKENENLDVNKSLENIEMKILS